MCGKRKSWSCWHIENNECVKWAWSNHVCASLLAAENLNLQLGCCQRGTETWRTFFVIAMQQTSTPWRHQPTPSNRWYSQVCDPGFTHGAGDGFDGRAQGVEQIRQLAGALRLPALLHDEAGHGDHVGVEAPSFGHGCGWFFLFFLPHPSLKPERAEAGGSAAGFKCSATRKRVLEGVKLSRANPEPRERRAPLLETLPALCKLNQGSDEMIMLPIRGCEQNNRRCASLNAELPLAQRPLSLLDSEQFKFLSVLGRLTFFHVAVP